MTYLTHFRGVPLLFVLKRLHLRINGRILVWRYPLHQGVVLSLCQAAHCGTTRRLLRAENVQGIFSHGVCAAVLHERRSACCSGDAPTCSHRLERLPHSSCAPRHRATALTLALRFLTRGPVLVKPIRQPPQPFPGVSVLSSTLWSLATGL